MATHFFLVCHFLLWATSGPLHIDDLAGQELGFAWWLGIWGGGPGSRLVLVVFAVAARGTAAWIYQLGSEERAPPRRGVRAWVGSGWF